MKRLGEAWNERLQIVGRLKLYVEPPQSSLFLTFETRRTEDQSKAAVALAWRETCAGRGLDALRADPALRRTIVAAVSGSEDNMRKRDETGEGVNSQPQLF